MVITGCTSVYSVISRDTASSILPDAKKIILNSATTPDSLYRDFFKVLSDNGYIIMHSSADMHQITAKLFMNKGGWDYGTLIMNILVSEGTPGSRAVITGVVSRGGESLTSEWKYRTNYSFAHMVKIVKQIPGTVMYSR
jgi:hypothetical protein